jgi:cytidyltransferase-like protein
MADAYRTVAVSGGFDCLHKGHVRMILEASQYGEVIVIANSDEWLTRKKGKPFMCWEERAEILSAIRGVTKVVKAKDDDGTVCETLRELKPTYFANGGDRTDINTPESFVCAELGITMLWGIGGGKIQSSSWLLDKVKN